LIAKQYKHKVNKKMTLLEWIAGDRIGISSKTIWGAIMGVEVDRDDKPYDPDDFSRCWKLVKRCNITKEQLEKVVDKYPYWKPYIDNWEKLTQMYERNRVEKWKNSKEKGLYEFMQELRTKSDLILRK